MLIKEVFSGFLKEKKEKVSTRTYEEYEQIIDLFEHSLQSYAWNNLEEDQAYEKAQEKKLMFIEIYDHSYIWENLGEFLNYFIPRKVNQGDEFVLKKCPRVMRDLLKWMREKQLLDKTNEEINEACENETWDDYLNEFGF